MASLTRDTLFEFQQEDIDKLQPHKSALIANEMGTGKTYEGVALDLFRRNGNKDLRTLVVCNKGQIEVTWGKHFRELTDLNVVCLDPKNRGAFLKRLPKEGGVFIVHWESLRLMPELKNIQWYHVIADEVHKMKSRKAQQTRAIKQIKTTFKTALSGTPATNKPHDFWSILNWLWPTTFRSYWKFYAEHVDYEIVYPQGFHKVKGPKNVDKLLQQIGPYYVRHLKKERCCDHHPNGVMAYLPDKVYETQWVDLLPVQRRAYDEMNKELVAWVGAQRDKPLIAPVVVAKLIRLQQFAIAYCDVNTVEKGEFDIETHVTMSEPSSKLDLLMDIIEEHVEEGQQLVIFSQFSQAIRLLGVRLDKAGYSHALYTGDTKQSDRDRIVKEFLEGKIQVFAGTIKAGGVGLDLYTASTVVFIDRAWSPAENLQAEDRLHRHGQKNSVRVVDLMARGTIDLGRKQQIDLKWEWIKELLGDK